MRKLLMTLGLASMLITVPATVKTSVLAEDSKTIVEYAPFTLKSGVKRELLIQAAQHVEDQFLKKQKGYVKRLLLQQSTSEWADIIYWESEEDAQAAAKAAYESPVCHAFFALMKGADHEDVSAIKHYHVVKSWKK